MFTFPILFPLVKPFRASRSGKPFYVHPLTADTGENKASVRTENFTEYPICTNCGRLPESSPSKSFSGT